MTSAATNVFVMLAAPNIVVGTRVVPTASTPAAPDHIHLSVTTAAVIPRAAT
jgi:hypothetical protein